MNTDKIEERLEKLHIYLMNNHGIVYVCKECGRQDFYESIGSLGSDSGMICDCGNEEMWEYRLSEYHQDIRDLLNEVERLEVDNSAFQISKSNLQAQLTAKDKEIEELKVSQGLPDPLVVEFGTGKINVHRFSTGKDFGLMFTDSGVERAIGDYGNKPAEESHDPQKGEIYLAFTNKESVQVVIEELGLIKGD